MSTRHYEFVKMTWEEIDRAAQAGRLALIPAGTIEDHGPHTPVDVDVVISGGICRRVAEQISDEVVLMPQVTLGYSPHHVDFPGTITIRWNTFIEWCLDYTRSLIHHGFTKILFVNGHGSNRPVLEMAARLTVVEHPGVHCAAMSWWECTAVREEVNRHRESEVVSHACELETSLYLHFDPEHVYMDKAKRDVHPYRTPHFWSDLVGYSPPGFRNAVGMTEYWSTVTEQGAMGDPSKATAEKGRRAAEAAVAEIIDIVRELKSRPVRSRVPHQTHLRDRAGELMRGGPHQPFVGGRAWGGQR